MESREKLGKVGVKKATSRTLRPCSTVECWAWFHRGYPYAPQPLHLTLAIAVHAACDVSSLMYINIDTYHTFYQASIRNDILQRRTSTVHGVSGATKNSLVEEGRATMPLS